MFVTNLFLIVDEVQALINDGWEFKVAENDVIKKAINSKTGDKVFFYHDEDLVKWIMSRYEIAD